METFPDLGALTDQELKELIQQLTEEEQELSYRRRILHGKIDILRAELVNRLRKKHEVGEPVITGADFVFTTLKCTVLAVPADPVAPAPVNGVATSVCPPSVNVPAKNLPCVSSANRAYRRRDHEHDASQTTVRGLRREAFPLAG